MEVLSKERTKWLEVNSTNIINLFGKYEYDSIVFKLTGTSRVIYMHGQILRAPWIKQIPDSLPKRVRFYSEKLGSKPLYYVNHSYKNAVWGFKVSGCEFVVYYSKRGLTIQFMHETTKKQFEKVIKTLYTKIMKRDDTENTVNAMN